MIEGVDQLEELIARIERADVTYWFEKIMAGLHEGAAKSDRETAEAHIPGLVTLREDLLHAAGQLYQSEDGYPWELKDALDQLAHPVKRLESHFMDEEPFNPDVESLGYYAWRLFAEAKAIVVPPPAQPQNYHFEE